MELHAKYSPSKLPRIVRCPGSVQLTANMSKGESAYAREGTMLHSVVEECLTLSEYTLSNTIITQYKLDKEQQDAVQEVLDWVFALKTKHSDDPDAYDLIETKVSLAGFADEHHCGELEDVYGTLDYSLVLPNKRLIICADWKFGKGVEVWPDTEQLLGYGLGKLKNAVYASKFDNVILVIGQPRLYSGELFKEHETTPQELLTWMKERLVPSLLNTKVKNPDFHPCDKACMWCEAKSVCTYRQKQSMEAAQRVFAVHAKLPNEVDLDQVEELLVMIPDLKKYIADIELFVVNYIKQGKQFPGRKLVPGRSIRKWKDEELAKDWLNDQGIDEWEASKLSFLSVAQIEKKFGKRVKGEKGFQELIHKPQGKPTLVKDSDPREALTFETAEEKFADFVED